MNADFAGFMPTVLLAIFIAANVTAMMWDIAKLEIPNTVSVVLILAFLAGGTGWSVLLEHVGVSVAALIIGVVFYRLGMWGGGDVKLAAALALWFGWAPLATWLFLIAVIGGVVALVILVFRRFPLPGSAPEWLLRLHARHEGIPYGVAICGGALLLRHDALHFLVSAGS